MTQAAANDEIEGALREALAEFAGPRGVVADASTWIVSAGAPQAASA